VDEWKMKTVRVVVVAAVAGLAFSVASFVSGRRIGIPRADERQISHSSRHLRHRRVEPHGHDGYPGSNTIHLSLSHIIDRMVNREKEQALSWPSLDLRYE